MNMCARAELGRKVARLGAQGCHGAVGRVIQESGVSVGGALMMGSHTMLLPGGASEKSWD